MAGTSINIPVNVEDAIQIEITKISSRKADFLRTIAYEPLSIELVQELRRGLQDWHKALPEPVSMSHPAKIPVTAQTRRLTYYLHLIHLGAIMVLYRRMLAKCVTERETSASTSAGLFAELFSLSEEGVVAAEQSARIAYLVFTEMSDSRQCWMCM